MKNGITRFRSSLFTPKQYTQIKPTSKYCLTDIGIRATMYNIESWLRNMISNMNVQ